MAYNMQVLRTESHATATAVIAVATHVEHAPTKAPNNNTLDAGTDLVTSENSDTDS
jgi:hypothetical protein